MKTTEVSSDFLDIDQYALDREAMDQSKKYHKFAVALADANKKMNDAESQKELIEAELSLDIRKYPENYGLEKITEGAIESTVACQEKYILEIHALNDAKHEVDVLKAGVAALDQRKRMLEKLIDLFLADYFSSPRVPGGSREAVNERKKSIAQDKIGRALNGKKPK